MVKNGTRYCDVCSEEIVKGEKYSVRTMPPESAALLVVTDDPELVPTWTQNLDGTVRLDICAIFYLSMGDTNERTAQ